MHQRESGKLRLVQNWYGKPCPLYFQLLVLNETQYRQCIVANDNGEICINGCTKSMSMIFGDILPHNQNRYTSHYSSIRFGMVSSLTHST